jgi:uncharacterized protein (TIGR00251 family)
MSGETIADISKYISNNSLRILVKPNSNKTEIMDIDEDNKIIKISVKAPADKNKTNLEIIKFFSKLSKKKARIKSGLKSKEKLIVFD